MEEDGKYMCTCTYVQSPTKGRMIFELCGKKRIIWIDMVCGMDKCIPSHHVQRRILW